MTKQLQFDFNRGAQLRLLADLVLDSVTRSAQRVKGLLSAIDNAAHGGPTVKVSQQRLAKIMGCSISTVKRAQAEAVKLGLLTVARSEYESTYAINWLTVVNGVESGVTAPPPSPPPVKQKPAETAQPRSSINKPRAGGWPLEVNATSLSSAESIRRLFDHAVGSQWIDHGDELRFFTLALSVARRSKEGSIESAGAAFTAAVKRRRRNPDRWSFGSEADEDKARQMVRKPTPPQAVDAVTSLAAAIRSPDPAPRSSELLEDYRRQLMARFPPRQKVLPAR